MEEVECSVSVDTSRSRHYRTLNRLRRVFKLVQIYSNVEFVSKSIVHEIRGKEYYITAFCKPDQKDSLKSFLWGYFWGKARKV